MPAPSLSAALWRIYNRPERPFPIHALPNANLPWDDPAFSARMLRQHLDETHAAASRQAPERQAQIQWLWDKLKLTQGQRLLDLTCGPGLYAVPLAERGLHLTGIDFGPAAIDYARELAIAAGVSDRCRFVQQDVRQLTLDEANFDAALLLYGQLAVMTRTEAQALLNQTAALLRPNATLCLELLNPAHVDKTDSNWWYTDDTGLWGDKPYLHLGERFWDAASRASVERYLILELETAVLHTITLCDQTYTPEDMQTMLHTAGFRHITHHPAWDGLPLYDAPEWIVYCAQK